MQRSEGDLYDARRWESAYRELHDVPALLVQLQDDLARSHKREAFWMSLVVHLIVVILIINSPKFARYFPHKTLVVGPNDWLRQKDLTYLELPPDEQKLTKRPNTNIISDKDRIATSRNPQLNREELRKILDSSRPGAPNPPAPAAPQQAQAAPAMAQNMAPQQQAEPAAAPPSQNQVARLQQPMQQAPAPSFNTAPLSAGSAIAQAARAAMANRGSYGGEGGGFGIGSRQAPRAVSQYDVLSDTMGVDFGPYLARVVHDVRENWYRIIPESAMAPLLKKGKVSIEFAIMKDGRIAGMTLAGTSGDTALDRAAWGGITASNPFPPLPTEFGGQYLALRFHFFYNPDKSDFQ